MKKIFLLSAALVFCSRCLSQNVDFTLISDTIVFDGQPYHAFWSSAVITNNNSDTVLIEAIREVNIVPNFPVWRSAMCADICYPYSTDTIQFIIPPLSDQLFEMRFEFTTHNTDTAHTRIYFHSLTPAENFSRTQNYFAMDSLVITSVNVENEVVEAISIFPNPATKELLVICYPLCGKCVIEIYSVSGLNILHKPLTTNHNQQSIDISSLNPGMYFLTVTRAVRKFVKQ